VRRPVALLLIGSLSVIGCGRARLRAGEGRAEAGAADRDASAPGGSAGYLDASAVFGTGGRGGDSPVRGGASGIDGIPGSGGRVGTGGSPTGGISGPGGSGGMDAGQDGSADASRTGKEGGADAGGVLACKGAFALGSLPLAETGRGPRSVALGDLDGDGKLDIVAANDHDATASVLLGKGDGTFVPRVDFSTGAYPYPSSVALGDLDGDGNLDMVVAKSPESSEADSSLGVFLGKGDGTFAAMVEYPTGGGSQSLALGDLNGDGRLDVATTNFTTSTVSVLLGKGDGTLDSRADYPTGDHPRQLALGDLDGDGKLDIVAANLRASTVSVLLGSGDGAFADKVDYSTGNIPTSLALGDLNRDGWLDIVTANQPLMYEKSTVSVLLGSGHGTFAEATSFPAENPLYWVTLADLDGDGTLDLILASGAALTVQRGKGDGTFAAAAYYPTSLGTQSLALGDLDHDGDLDLVVAISMDGASVMLGDGSGAFSGSWALPTGIDRRMDTRLVALGDIDGDGMPDMVAATQGKESVSVLLGRGSGAFGAKVDYPTGLWVGAVALGDVNADGRLDMVAACSAAALGDVNRDGKLDIVVTVDPTKCSGPAVGVFLGKGDGTFAARVESPVGDVPSKADAAPTTFPEVYLGTASVLLGQGDGTFTVDGAYSVGLTPGGVALGDLDGDGRLDIVVANTGMEGSGSMSILLAKADGAFAGKVDYTSSAPRAVALGDLDGDGKLDVVMADYRNGDGAASVWLGQGNGTFAAPVYYQTGDWAESVALGDVDGDGTLDIVIPGSGVRVLVGKGDGTFAIAADYAAYASSVALGDLDGDGRLDVVTANPLSVGALLNTCLQ
jgi:hypothetical protein